MSYDTYLNFLLMVEIHMIMHFSRHKSICTLFNSIRQHKVTCAATDSHSLYRSAQQLVTHDALHVKGPFQHQYKIVSSHWLGQFGKDHRAFLSFWQVAMNRHRPHLLCHLEVYSIQCVIHICMHGYNTEVVFDSLDNTTLYKITTTDLFQSTEQQRVVAHNEITPLADGFVNNLFVDVQTQ